MKVRSMTASKTAFSEEVDTRQKHSLDVTRSVIGRPLAGHARSSEMVKHLENWTRIGPRTRMPHTSSR